jgi:hypothetical protein
VQGAVQSYYGTELLFISLDHFRAVVLLNPTFDSPRALQNEQYINKFASFQYSGPHREPMSPKNTAQR